MPSITATSAAFCTGRRTPSIPFSRAIAVIESAPRMGLTLPSRDSSPRITIFFKRSLSIIPLAERIPMAIGKSNAEPSLRISAGARLTVILRTGRANWVLRMAAETRSLLSLTAASGRPTMDMPGSPCERLTSTSTG